MMEDYRKQYEAMTNEELLNLALDSEQLNPEARISLDSELSRRQIGRDEIDKYSQDQKGQEPDKEYNPKTAYWLFPRLRRFGGTLDDWKRYRRHTGEWPRRSIAFYFFHLLVQWAGLGLIVWYSARSKGLFLIVAVPLITLDVAVSNWIQKRIRLSEIAHHRHARGLESGL